MKKAVLGVMIAMMAVAMVSTDVWAKEKKAKKDGGSAASGTLAVAKDDKGTVTGITITTKSGTVYNVDMTGFTQNVTELEGKEVSANGEVKDVEGKMMIKVSGDIVLATEKKGKGKKGKGKKPAGE